MNDMHRSAYAGDTTRKQCCWLLSAKLSKARVFRITAHAHALSWSSWVLCERGGGERWKLPYEAAASKNDDDRIQFTLDYDACRPDEVRVDSLVDELATLGEVFPWFRRTDDFIGRKPCCCNTAHVNYVNFCTVIPVSYTHLTLPTKRIV